MEPDVVDLAKFLIKMGAKISGHGTERIEIEGVAKLKPVTYSIMPDRIEAGTYLIAGAATRGSVTVRKVVPEHFGALSITLREMGFLITEGKDFVTVSAGKKVQGVMIETQPFPGFPTDLQAPLMSLMTTLPGISVIIETIFENRYTHIAELKRLGAEIITEGKSAIIKGPKKLLGAPVMMSDLRAGASLIVAGLISEGETEIRRIYHSDRGYEKLPTKLKSLGAVITREAGKG